MESKVHWKEGYKRDKVDHIDEKIRVANREKVFYPKKQERRTTNRSYWFES